MPTSSLETTLLGQALRTTSARLEQSHAEVFLTHQLGGVENSVKWLQPTTDPDWDFQVWITEQEYQQLPTCPWVNTRSNIGNLSSRGYGQVQVLASPLLWVYLVAPGIKLIEQLELRVNFRWLLTSQREQNPQPTDELRAFVALLTTCKLGVQTNNRSDRALFDQYLDDQLYGRGGEVDVLRELSYRAQAQLLGCERDAQTGRLTPGPPLVVRNWAHVALGLALLFGGEGDEHLPLAARWYAVLQARRQRWLETSAPVKGIYPLPETLSHLERTAILHCGELPAVCAALATFDFPVLQQLGERWLTCLEGLFATPPPTDPAHHRVRSVIERHVWDVLTLLGGAANINLPA